MSTGILSERELNIGRRGKERKGKEGMGWVLYMILYCYDFKWVDSKKVVFLI